MKATAVGLFTENPVIVTFTSSKYPPPKEALPTSLPMTRRASGRLISACLPTSPSYTTVWHPAASIRIKPQAVAFMHRMRFAGANIFRTSLAICLGCKPLPFVNLVLCALGIRGTGDQHQVFLHAGNRFLVAADLAEEERTVEVPLGPP